VGGDVRRDSVLLPAPGDDPRTDPDRWTWRVSSDHGQRQADRGHDEESDRLTERYARLRRELADRYVELARLSEKSEALEARLRCLERAAAEVPASPAAHNAPSPAEVTKDLRTPLRHRNVPSTEFLMLLMLVWTAHRRSAQRRRPVPPCDVHRSRRPRRGCARLRPGDRSLDTQEATVIRSRARRRTGPETAGSSPASGRFAGS
jgi:hypothetical protein